MSKPIGYLLFVNHLTLVCHLLLLSLQRAAHQRLLGSPATCLGEIPNLNQHNDSEYEADKSLRPRVTGPQSLPVSSEHLNNSTVMLNMKHKDGMDEH